MSTIRPHSRSVRFIRRHFFREGMSLLHTFLLIGGALGFLGMGIIALWLLTIDIPSIDGFHNRKVAESTKIFDRTGKVLLYDVHGTVRRTAVGLDEISRHAKNATVAIEDAEFYEHFGIKPTAIARAVFANIKERRYSQGGSTITQQVVKNTMLSTEKTITRKVKEWILAIRLEQLLTKDQILEIYLNETPYGGTIYGVEEASQYFFGVSANNLSLAQAAYLAALPQAPTYYSPYGNHRSDLEERKNLVLLKMKEHGFINEQEYGTALTEQVIFSKNDDNGIRAPHFVFFVREYLEEKYGTERVSEGGLTVVTTLDWKLQEQAEEIVKRNALKNEKVYNAENAALVAIDPKTGQILSMVGSRDYFDDAIDGKYNVAVAERQPGSSFKPFAYATAFAKGLRPETVVFDLPTQFSTNCAADDFSTSDTCYSPGNYDDTFRGPMSLRDALAQSVNIPAVKVLYIAGIKETLDTAKRLGITTLNRPLQQYGLPLVLGGGEVKLLDIVSAYGVFANNGTRHPATPILSIKDKEGDIVEEYTTQEEQALDSDVAKTINNVLSDNTARIPAFGANSALVIPGRTVAAKTGTTNDYRDVWIIGYTPSIAVGAWAGNNNNTPMEKKVAGFIVAPLWNEFMQAALKDTVDEPFDPPSEKPDDVAPILKGVWQTEEGVHSILYWINKDAPLGPRPEYPARDGQFLLWEYPVQYWAQNGGVPAIPETSVTEVPSTPSTPSAPPFFITSPQQGARIPRNTLMTVQVSNPFGENLQKVSYSINGVFIGTSQGAPFSISFVPTTPGQTVIQVIGVSTLGEYRTQTTVFVE